MAYNLKSFTGFEKNNSIKCFLLDGLLWGSVEMNASFLQLECRQAFA